MCAMLRGSRSKLHVSHMASWRPVAVLHTLFNLLRAAVCTVWGLRGGVLWRPVVKCNVAKHDATCCIGAAAAHSHQTRLTWRAVTQATWSS